MIDLQYWTTPNGHKITIALEEMGTPYRIVPVNISAGEQQFAASFLRVSPNNRPPSSIMRRKTAASRLRSSNPVRSSNISPRRPASSCLEHVASASRCCNGYTGRWRDLTQWPARITTSPTTRQSRYPLGILL